MLGPDELRFLLPLRNHVQHYDWGCTTRIPELLGTNERPGVPHAELWIGAHPRAPSDVLVHGKHRPLDAQIAADPVKMLGERVVEDLGGELPFLLKVLAAARPLSIQSHPSREQAREGFERENREGVPLDAPHRNYRDPNPKPEVIVALEPFRALRGFRPIETIRAAFGRLADPSLDRLLDRLPAGADEEGLRDFYVGLMSMSADEQRDVTDRVSRRAETVAKGGGKLAEAFACVSELHGEYPGDIAVVSPLLLNLVTLRPFESLYLDAGTLHAYLDGLGVEIMGNSDNVLRGGLTSKHIDLDELCRTVTFRPDDATPRRPRPIRAHESVFPSDADSFELSMIELDGDRYDREPTDSIELLLVQEGAITIHADGDDAVITKGGSAAIPASAGTLRFEGTGRMFRARVPERRER